MPWRLFFCRKIISLEPCFPVRNSIRVSLINEFSSVSVVLYGCETWPLTLREEHRLRVFENRVLSGIFVPKRDEVTGEWRKLHNEELHNLCLSPNIITLLKSSRMRWVGHVARMREERKLYEVLVGKPEGKRTLGRSRCRWDQNGS
jgi:hypothetical protein